MPISTSLDIEIGGFQSNIKQAQGVLKGLNAEMKAADAAFKATGNAEQKLTSQTKTLNSTIQMQKGIADQARQALDAMTKAGVDPLDKEYQKLYATMVNAEAGMNEAQAALNNLGAGAAQAADGAEQLTKGLNGISKKISLDQVISGIDRITSGLENAAKKAIQLGEDLWNTIMDSASRADDTATMAEMYGIDLDTFQRMQKLVAGGMDTSVEAMLRSQKKLRKGIGDGSKEVQETLSELGITVKEWQTVAGESGSALITKDQTKLFWEAGQALNNLGEEYDKESKAQRLFGRSWEELVPLFNAYKSYEEYQEALGSQTVNTEETIRDLAELNDAVGKLEGSWTTLKDELIGAVAPALTGAADAVSGLLNNLTEYLKTDEGQKMLTDLGTAVSGLFEDLGKIDPASVVEGFTGVFNTVVDSVKWISDNWEGVVTALEGIVIGWGALEITGGILEIVKVVNGLQGLSSGGAAQAGAAAGSAWGGAFAKAVMTAAPWLIGLYTLLNPAGTAGDNIDSTVVNGQVTEAGVEFWNNNLDAWNARQMAVGNRYGDLATIMANNEALNIMLRTDLDDEQMFEELEKTIGLKPVDVNVDPVVGADAASSISEQVGTVEINGVLHMVDAEGNDIGDLGDWTGEYVGGHGKRRKPKANGIWSVPYDGYLATLHRGERVVPAREVQSRSYNSNLYVESMIMNNGTDAAGLAAAMAAAQRRTMSGYGS